MACPRWCTRTHAANAEHGRHVGLSRSGYLVTIHQAPAGAPRISVFDPEGSDEYPVHDLSAEQAEALGHILRETFLGSLLTVAAELVVGPHNPDADRRYLLEMGADPVKPLGSLDRRIWIWLSRGSRR